jgi:hypothetical protein
MFLLKAIVTRATRHHIPEVRILYGKMICVSELIVKIHPGTGCTASGSDSLGTGCK